MSDFTTSRPGQVNGAGDPRAIFLTKFGGEVINRLLDKLDTKDMIFNKQLNGAKNYQFPYTGTLKATYHVPGTELSGQVTNQNAKTIGLDDLMVVDRFVPKIDKWMKHYDETAVYADEMANALGLAMDVNNFHEAILGARVATPLVDGNVDAIGEVITNDKFKLTGVGPGAVDDIELAEAIRGAVKIAATKFKEKRVPDAIEKVCYLNWEDYYTILNAVDTNGFSLFNKDYASGNIESGMLPPLYGIRFKGTNNLPTTDLSAIASPQTPDTGVHFYHQGNFTKTRGLIMCKGAVGQVMASDIAMEADAYSARHKGQLLTADYFCGHGWLRPEYLIELELDTLTNA
jgi:hypothetical protein